MKPELEPTAVDWSRARALLADLKSAVRRSLATKCLLGKTLTEIQKQLGFTHGSQVRFSPRTQTAFMGENAKTWGDWCKDELGISHDTAGRYIRCFEAICRRAKDRPDIRRLLQTPTEKLNGDEITALAARASFLVCDETETSLLAELKHLKDQEPKKRKTAEAKAKEQQDLTQIAARVIFGDAHKHYKKLKSELQAVFSDALGKAILGDLDVLPDDPKAVSLVGIRDHFSELVNDIESDLKTLVRTLDVEIKKRLPDAAKRLKSPTKKAPTKSKR